MSMPAEKVEVDASTLRRFELPDVDRHGLWLLPRLRQAYPHLNDRQVIGWLRGICYSAEYLFLYQEYSVALFQTMSSHTLAPEPVIHERFVFCSNREDPQHQAQAGFFYAEAKKWAKHQGAGAIVGLCEKSDVPLEIVREHLKRISERKELFCKISRAE